MIYTTEELEAARERLRAVNGKWDRYSGNNPYKYRSERESAWEEVQRIESYLKSAGVIPLTDKEKLDRELNAAFPNARSKEIVEHQGVRYQRLFSPGSRSRSGSVTSWNKSWTKVA